VNLCIGGAKLVAAPGHDRITTYHMNEGHSALLARGLPEADGGGPVDRVTEEARERVRRRCVFTTPTPVPVEHDRFPAALVREVLGESGGTALLGCDGRADELNMTGLALTFSRHVDGVALRHEQVSRSMFPGYPNNSVTNGAHAVAWAADAFRALYARHRHVHAGHRPAGRVPLPERRVHRVRPAHLPARGARPLREWCPPPRSPRRT